jgi:hypothetical protein
MKVAVCASLVFTALAAAPPPPERLLADAASLENPAALAEVKGRHVVVFRGQAGESGFNLHSYLAFFDGRFWLCWSSAKVNEEDPDQHLMYSTSIDGRTWAPEKVLAADPDGPAGPQRWIARGMFLEGGKLRALGALVESADYGNRGKGVVWRNLQLIRFTWTGSGWTRDEVFASDCMNNFPPERLAGRYVMPCRDSGMNLKVAYSDAPGSKAWKSIPIVSEPPFHRMDEPTLYVAPDGTYQMIIRDGSRAGFLIRSVSRDKGATWSAPVRTNYPDATSKNYVLRLSNGEYALINNPDQKRRDPLAISFSRDGWVFGGPMALRKNAPSRRAGGRPGAAGSFQYPHAIEHNGSLWVAYSTNKEDIEVSEYRLADLVPAGGGHR